MLRLPLATLLLLSLLASSVSATGLLDPLGVLGAAKEGVLDAADGVNKHMKDKLTLNPGNGEIVGDRDPSNGGGSGSGSGGGGLLSSLHLPGLNLFSGVPCIGSASFLSGKCDKPSECGRSGRVADGSGLCLDGNVCCVETFKCGAMSLLNNSIFSSPNYPSGTTQTGRCTMTVKKMSLLVRAIRVVLEDVLLAPPNHRGECETDSLWIEGVNHGSELARVCGRITSQPLYFPVSESTDDTIRVKIVLGGGSLQRRWMIRIIQVDMLSPSLPPPGCTQYFTGTSGALVSFNTDVSNRTSLGNIDGLRYSICLRKEAGFCKVEFDPVFFDMGSAPAVDHEPMSSGHDLHRALYTFEPMDAPTRSRRDVDERAPLRLPIHRYRPIARPLHVSAHGPMYSMLPPPSSHAPAPMRRPLIYSDAALNRLLDEKLESLMREYGLANPHSPLPPSMVHPSSSPYAAYPPSHAPAAAGLPYSPAGAAAAAAGPSGYKPIVGGAGAGAASVPYHPINEIVDTSSPAKVSAAEGELTKICAGQDIISFPPPDDETPSVHCGFDFHGGQQMTTSSRPFIIRVNNKGIAHGRGFILKYRHILC